MTNTTNRQELIDSVLEALNKVNQKNQPTHYVITYAYTGHEEYISYELSTVEKVVDEFIDIVKSHKVTEDCQYLEIEAHWRQPEFIEGLYLYELQDSSKWKLL